MCLNNVPVMNIQCNQQYSWSHILQTSKARKFLKMEREKICNLFIGLNLNRLTVTGPNK